MARENPNETLVNPAKIFAKWTGEGKFIYYDKETSTNIILPDDFTFIVLAEYITIKGWDENAGSGIYSNEIKDLQKETLNIRSFKGGELLVNVYYKDAKEKIMALGGWFCSSVYIAYKNSNNELEIGNISFERSSLGAWFDFKKENKAGIYTHAIQLDGKISAKKGSTNYFIPVFKLVKISGSTEEKAGELQKELMQYHKKYFNKLPTDDIIERELEDVKSTIKTQTDLIDSYFPPEDEPIDKLPF